MDVIPDCKLVCPGDCICALPETGRVRIGTGIFVEDGHLVTARSGIARQTKGGKIWIEGRQKRYIPAVGDAVIGLIIDRYGESWKVDITSPFPASLGALAFEGVTRRNRPNLQPGDLVYARIISAPRDAEPAIACTDADGKAVGYGHLKDGYLEHCSTSLARKLLSSPTAPVLVALGGALQYEIAVGTNGRLWLKSANVTTTILIANAVVASEFLSEAQCGIMVEKLLSAADVSVKAIGNVQSV